MNYEIKKFNNLFILAGFSEEVIKNHLALYEGYVNNINKLNTAITAMEKENKFSTPEFAELNRRFGWEWNGMRLHELYFNNLTKEENSLKSGSPLLEKIIKEWGSYEMWERDFRGMGAMRGIGWIILYYDKSGERLFNVWINEHDAGHFSGAAPLLVMDVFEHAYMIDYGLKRADYIAAFFKNINWDVAEERLGD